MSEVAPIVLADTLNAHWKNNKTSFGYRMLQKMGWDEDQGLGKDGTGIVNHVKLKKRETALGLGMDGLMDDTASSKAWSATATNFNSVLDVLKQSYPKDKKDRKDRKERREKVEKVEKKSKRALVSTGIRYHKLRAAKDLSTKSTTDKKAIFGHHHVSKQHPEEQQQEQEQDEEEQAQEEEQEKKRRKKDKKSKDKVA